MRIPIGITYGFALAIYSICDQIIIFLQNKEKSIIMKILLCFGTRLEALKSRNVNLVGIDENLTVKETEKL